VRRSSRGWPPPRDGARTGEQIAPDGAERSGAASATVGLSVVGAGSPIICRSAHALDDGLGVVMERSVDGYASFPVWAVST